MKSLEKLMIDIEILMDQVRDTQTYSRQEISLMCDRLLELQETYQSRTGRYYNERLINK